MGPSCPALWSASTDIAAGSIIFALMLRTAGAVMAAANFVIQGSASVDLRLRLAADATVPGPGRDAALAATGMTNSHPEDGPVLMPCLRVTLQDLEQEIRQQLGSSSSKVCYSVDKKLQSIFAEHPDVQTLKAQRMGFAADANLKDLVKAVL